MARTIESKKSLTGKPLAQHFLSVFPTFETLEGPIEAAPVPITSPELAADIEAAAYFPDGFRHWLPHWRFMNRERLVIQSFREMWPGQEGFADLMIDVAEDAIRSGDWRGIFALKAGKLGFTELECAWDGYVAWARAHSRVHLFSKMEDAAKVMLTYVRDGLARMERAWGIRFVDSQGREVPWNKSGSSTFRFTVARDGEPPDLGDIRTVLAFATGEFPAIDQSAQHAHVDEWAHMEHPGQVWGSINTTIAPAGTVHIVTRGAGEEKAVEDTWTAAVTGVGKVRSYFAPWHARSDRDQAWYEEQAASTPTLALLAHYAAETPEDAFRGDEDNDFVPIEQWDACKDQYLIDNPLQPGAEETAVAGVDAATHRDIFAIVLVTRHPTNHDNPAIRLVKTWAPEDFESGAIDYATVEAWLRCICQGGCGLHPQYEPWIGGKMGAKLVGQTWEPGACPGCAAIAAGQAQPIAAYNVWEIAYDPYQLESMMQALKRDGVCFVREFSQGKDRLEADRHFRDVIVSRRLSHPANGKMREHVAAAMSKTQKDEDSKLRIVKKAPHRRIDTVVAASMATREIMRLNL